jgi:hypothetical protein
MKAIFLIISCILSYVAATTVYMYTSNGELCASSSECNVNYFPPCDVSWFTVSYGGQWVYWYNSDDSFLFVSKSSGTVYASDGANNFEISC